jgi:L(+)-tartrate dehydratase beta subunit
VEYREDPQWFTPYARREGLEWTGDEPAPSTLGGEGIKGLGRLEPGRVIPLIEVQTPPPGPLTRGERGDLAPLPGTGRGQGVGFEPQEGAAPREWHLAVPLSEADVLQLRAGDIVYLSGCIFTARDGVYKYMLDEGHEPPIDIRQQYNVTTQSSPAGTEVAPGQYMVNSLQATAGFRYAQWMERLFDRYGVRAVINKGGMSEAMYRSVFRKYGAVCLSTMPYGIGAIYGKEVTGVRDVFWKEHLGMSEAMWLLEVQELGPLLVDGDAEGNSYVAQHAAEVNAPLKAIYRDLPELILKRIGEVQDPAEELIK